MPYLHWDKAQHLEIRDRILRCRSHVQSIQELVADGMKNTEGGNVDPCAWPTKVVKTPFSSQEPIENINSRQDFERSIQNFLKKQKAARHRLLYNYAITSRIWDGELHPMRSLLQYGRPFLEDAFYEETKARNQQTLLALMREMEDALPDFEKETIKRMAEHQKK